MNCPYNGKFKVTQTYNRNHDGLDLVGISSKDIHSTVNGEVVYAGWESVLNKKKGFGQYVKIRQKGTNLYYYYGHLSSIKVKIGQTVKIGQVIGIEGNTGYSTGSHCHYCVREYGIKGKDLNISKISGIPNEIGIYDDSVAPKSKITCEYRIWDNNKKCWLSKVKDLEDYAGIYGHSIGGYQVYTYGGGTTKIRAHVKGGVWLPEVIDGGFGDKMNEYAGLKGLPIDAITMWSEHGDATYRVHILGGDWLPWISGRYGIKDTNDYAGIIGKTIDAIQICIK